MATETIPVRTHKHALKHLDPFEEMHRQMARFWQAWPVRWPILGSLKPSAEAQPWAPSADMFEKGNKLVLEMDLPGMKKDDVDVSLEEGDLVLKGKREQEKEVSTEDYYRMERASGSFYRRIPLPFDVEARNVQARFEDGVLRIEIPKPLQAKPQIERVKVH